VQRSRSSVAPLKEMHTVRCRPLISKPMTTKREMGVTAGAATEEGAMDQGATEQGATAERTTEKGVTAESVMEEGATEVGATEEEASWHPASCKRQP